MAFYDDMFKGFGGSGAGIATGVGALLLAPLVLPVIGRVIRPVARTALETGIVLYREVGHAASGLVSEARAELEAREPATAPSVADEPPAPRPRRRKQETAPA